MSFSSKYWFTYPYGYPDLYWGGCRRFHWLPRWWWTGIYGSIPPYAPIPREQEISMLEDQAKLLEESLGQVRKRLEELRKEE